MIKHLVSSPFYSGSSSLEISEDATFINQTEGIKTSTPYLNGYRLKKDVSFYTDNGLKGANRISGKWNPGFSLHGSTLN